MATITSYSKTQADTLLGGKAAAAVALSNRPQALATFGDSITWAKTGGEVAWPDLVADYLALGLFNPSVPGENPANIALRAASIRPTFSVPGGTIPAASATRVAVTLTSGETNFKAGSASFPNIGNYTGRFRGVDVTLRHRDEDGWTIARAVDGAAVTVPAGSWPFATTAARTHRDDITVIWAGRNNVNNLVSWTQKIVDNLVGSPKRYLVLGVLTGGGEAAGNAAYDNVVAANTALATAFGVNYFDMRRHLIDNGLAQAGITATTQDTADKNSDTVPTSLRVDQIHPNIAANRVIARKVAELIMAKGWSPTVTLPALEPGAPAPTTTVLDMPTNTALASVATPTAMQTAQNLSIRMVGRFDNLNLNQALIQRVAGTDQRSWQLGTIANTPRFRFQTWSAGTVGSNTAADSTVEIPYTPGSLFGVRVDFDVAARTVTFYTAADGVTWAQLGAVKATATTATLFGGTSPVEITGWGGDVKSVKITSLDGATTYIDEDFSDGVATGWAFSGGAAFL